MSSGWSPLLPLLSPAAVPVHSPALELQQELQIHRAAASCLSLWGWQVGLSFFSLSPFFSTNTGWRAACFHLQKIVALNYINSRSKCSEKGQITWKNEAKIKRKTLQTEETSRKYSFAAAHCSETTNSEIQEKWKELENFRLEYFFPQEILQSFLFYFCFGRMNYLDLILPVNHCGQLPSLAAQSLGVVNTYPLLCHLTAEKAPR